MTDSATNATGGGGHAPGLLKRYLLPGFIFQSVVIAGGYGTGRELAEFFLPYGPKGGLLAMMLVSMTFWSECLPRSSICSGGTRGKMARYTQ